jgi:diacylglycerol kinase
MQSSQAFNRREMRAFFRSFFYAFQGIAHVLRTQRNALVEIALALLAIVAAIFFRVSAVEWAVLALAIGMVFSAEMINTVAELAVDVLVSRHDRRAKTAKDVGAGAVLVSAMAAVAVGIAVFGPRIQELLFGR